MERKQRRDSQLANSLSERMRWLAFILKRQQVMVMFLVCFSHFDLVVLF